MGIKTSSWTERSALAGFLFLVSGCGSPGRPTPIPIPIPTPTPTVTPQPSVLEVRPSSTWPLFATKVHGTGLVAETRVLVDGIPALIQSHRSNGITFALPFHAPGLVDVELVDPRGQSTVLKNAFTYLAASLVASTATAAPGVSVSVTWFGPPSISEEEGPLHDLGLYRVGEPDDRPVWIRPIWGSTGEAQVTLPNTPGNYEFRYFMYQKHLLTKSQVIVVGPTSQ